MRVVKVQTLDRITGNPLDVPPYLYVVGSLGEALDTHAPDPAVNARFTVEYAGVTTNNPGDPKKLSEQEIRDDERAQIVTALRSDEAYYGIANAKQSAAVVLTEAADWVAGELPK